MSNTKKSNRGKMTYWVTLLIYVAALSLLAFLVLKGVWAFAEQYQASQPEPVIDEYVAKLNENLIDSGVADTIASMPHEVQTDEEVQAAVSELLNGEISYQNTNEGSGDTSVYALLCNGSSFGKVYLTKDTTKSAEFEIYGVSISYLNQRYDLRPWVIEKEEFDFTGLYTSVEVTIPESYTVQLNGHTLGSEYIIESGIHYDCLEDYYSINPDLPTKVTYRFDDIIGIIEPVIYDESGAEYTVDSEQDDSQYIKPCDDATLERISAFMDKFIPTYCDYTSAVHGEYSEGYYSEVAQYLVPDSDLANRLYQAIDGYSWAHVNSYKFNGYTLDNAIDLGEGYYVCNVTADTTYSTNVLVDQNDIKELNVLILDSDGEILAVSMV